MKEKTNSSIEFQRKSAVLLMVIYVLLLLPVLYLGRYDYHCADDFGFSATSHIVWENTHSLAAVFQAAGKTVIERWHTWQGTFTTMFMMAIEPGIFGDVFYCFVPWIMIGAMTISTMFFFYILLVKLIDCDKWIWISISMTYLIFVLECMVNPLQGFFWYNGAVHYMIPHSLVMVFVSFMIKARIQKGRLISCIITCLLAFLLGGCNYITALGVGVGFGFAIIISLFLRRKEILWIYLLPFFFYLPSFLINVLAPGNSVRQAAVSNQQNPVKAILLAFYFCIERAFANWLDWKILAFCFVIAPFLLLVVNNINKKNGMKFKCPLIVLFLSFCFLSSLFAPTSYVAGEAGGGRVENIIFLDFILLIVFNEAYLIGWLDSKLNIMELVSPLKEKKNFVLYYYGIIAIIVLFFAGLTVARDENNFTTTSAVTSIISGEAKSYGQETRARTIMIEEHEGDTLIVPRFVECPYLLYMDDIVPDSDDWKNNSMERYYGIKEIKSYSID